MLFIQEGILMKHLIHNGSRVFKDSGSASIPPSRWLRAVPRPVINNYPVISWEPPRSERNHSTADSEAGAGTAEGGKAHCEMLLPSCRDGVLSELWGTSVGWDFVLQLIGQNHAAMAALLCLGGDLSLQKEPRQKTLPSTASHCSFTLLPLLCFSAFAHRKLLGEKNAPNWDKKLR